MTLRIYLYLLLTGVNEETQKPTVGFRLASYKGGSVYVGPISKVKVIPKEMLKVVEVNILSKCSSFSKNVVEYFCFFLISQTKILIL